MNTKWDIKLEVGNYCNLKCPHCARNFIGDYKLNTKHVSLETIKKWLPKSFILLKTNKIIRFTGVVAEPSLNPDFIDIIKHFLMYDCDITVETNGSTNNENWWYELGKTGIKCYFSPNSLKQNNNIYRINSNTEKVIANMKSFISGGGNASWKYLPFKHNEDEYDTQKNLVKKIGASFAITQPGWFNDEDEKEIMKPSKYFPNSKLLVTSTTTNKNPEDYCMVVGNGGKLLEISPDGIVYPCCFVSKPLFSIYAPFLNGGNESPCVDQSRVKTNLLYKYFVEDILPLIENQGGIKSLSLYHNNIKDILNTDIFTTSLKQSWKKPNKFCTEMCRARKFIISET